VSGILLTMGDVIPGRSSLDLLAEAYGKLTSGIAIQQANVDAYQLITQALAAGQTGIHLPAGNYSVSQQVNINNIDNVEIYGDGQDDTILRLNDNVYGGSNSSPKPATVLSFVEADNFHVHDLQIDGNAAGNPFQGNPATAYAMDGILGWNSSNGLINNCLIHDCRFMGVQLEVGSNCIVQDNTILNSNANGISVSNAGNHGSGYQVLNNMVNGASDVGISVWEGVSALVHGNNVQNVTLNLSPYQQNTHVGILAEGQAPCRNVIFSNNTVSNISSPITKYPGLGMGAGPDGSSNIQFLNNTFENVYQMARIVGAMVDISVTGNTVNGTLSLTYPVLNVSPSDKGTSPNNVSIEGNVFNGTPTGMVAYIISIISGSGKFINNTIYTNGNKALLVWHPTYWVSSPNTMAVVETPTPSPTLLLSAPSSESQGQRAQLSITAFNPTNSPFNAKVMIEIMGPNNYLMFDVVQVNVAAASQSTLYYVWSAPNQSGTYSVSVSLAPPTPSGFSTATVQIM